MARSLESQRAKWQMARKIWDYGTNETIELPKPPLRHGRYYKRRNKLTWRTPETPEQSRSAISNFLFVPRAGKRDGDNTRAIVGGDRCCYERPLYVVRGPWKSVIVVNLRVALAIAAECSLENMGKPKSL